MSGHSKWATTKHKKAVVDARRGKLFAKLIKNVEVAARTGGARPGRQPDARTTRSRRPRRARCPTTTSTARSSAAPALEAGGADYETITYEGYAPGGVAVLVECLTDNRNRAASDVRVALTRNGGSMADPGSVSYLFNRKGVVIVPKAAGVDRGRRARAPCSTPAPRRSTTSASPSRWSARPPTWSRCAPRCRRPASTTSRPRPRSCRRSRCRWTRSSASKVFRLIEALEDSDDVQDVYANYSVPDEIMEKLG